MAAILYGPWCVNHVLKGDLLESASEAALKYMDKYITLIHNNW